MRFVINGMLKGLIRWLRFLGFDSIELDPEDKDYSDRFFLTASPKHYQDWMGKNKILIPFDNIPEQLNYLNEKLNIYAQIKFLSRCSVCNEEILSVPKEKISGHIPEKVLDSFEKFYQCPSCNRIYWEGGHVERMIRKLERMGVQIKSRRSDE